MPTKKCLSVENWSLEAAQPHACITFIHTLQAAAVAGTNCDLDLIRRHHYYVSSSSIERCDWLMSSFNIIARCANEKLHCRCMWLTHGDGQRQHFDEFDLRSAKRKRYAQLLPIGTALPTINTERYSK